MVVGRSAAWVAKTIRGWLISPPASGECLHLASFGRHTGGWVKSLQTCAQDRLCSYAFLWGGIFERGGFGKLGQGRAIVAVLRFGVPWCQIVNQRGRVGQRMAAVSLLVEMVKVMPGRLLDNGFRPQRMSGVYRIVYRMRFHNARIIDWQGFQTIVR